MVRRPCKRAEPQTDRSSPATAMIFRRCDDITETNMFSFKRSYEGHSHAQSLLFLKRRSRLKSEILWSGVSTVAYINLLCCLMLRLMI